jgi:hypothetical protein
MSGRFFSAGSEALRDIAPRKNLFWSADAVRVAGADVLVQFDDVAEILPTDRARGLLDLLHS